MKILLTLSISTLFLLTLSQTSFADWFGISAVAGATWKVIAINAIESAKFVILMGMVLFSLTWTYGKFGELSAKVTQDNIITKPERWLLSANFIIILCILSLVLPLGFKLLGVLLS